MDDLKQRAEWLRQTRIMLQAASITHASLELLLWIAAGVDRTPELVEATGRAVLGASPSRCPFWPWATCSLLCLQYKSVYATPMWR